MNKIIFVKHSLPEIDPEKPASKWMLSEEGLSRSRSLTKKLEKYNPEFFYTSNEPKAFETAAIISGFFGKNPKPITGFHEHLREQVQYLTKMEFESQIAAFFDNQDQLVFGEETASQALNRFFAAVDSCLSDKKIPGTIVIVTHGTVLTLFVSQFNRIDKFDFWRSLKMPSFVVLSLPGFLLEQGPLGIE